MSRNGFKITSDNGRVDWLDSFAEKFDQKSAVEVARARSQASIMDQISAIMGGRNRYSSVDHAVADMQERTGLKEYLDMTRAAQANHEKVAQKKTSEPEFKNISKELKDALLKFVQNRAKSNRASVPSVQYEVLNQFKELSPEDVNNEDVARYINELILEDQASKGISGVTINIDLGAPEKEVETKDNNNDNDFLRGLMPASK